MYSLRLVPPPTLKLILLLLADTFFTLPFGASIQCWEWWISKQESI